MLSHQMKNLINTKKTSTFVTLTFAAVIIGVALFGCSGGGNSVAGATQSANQFVKTGSKTQNVASPAQQAQMRAGLKTMGGK